MAYRVTFAAALLAMAVLAATANTSTIASGNARPSGDSYYESRSSANKKKWCALDYGVLTNCAPVHNIHFAHNLQDCTVASAP